jgi:hypothetical protein
MPSNHHSDPETFADLRAGLIAVYRPVNSQELFAIERIALAQQSILRSYRLEAGLEFPADPGNFADWALVLRYQAQAERLYRRALEELQRLQALRGTLPAEDLNQPETEPKPKAQAPALDPRRLPRHIFKRRPHPDPRSNLADSRSQGSGQPIPAANLNELNRTPQPR